MAVNAGFLAYINKKKAASKTGAKKPGAVVVKNGKLKKATAADLKKQKAQGKGKFPSFLKKKGK